MELEVTGQESDVQMFDGTSSGTGRLVPFLAFLSSMLLANFFKMRFLLGKLEFCAIFPKNPENTQG